MAFLNIGNVFKLSGVDTTDKYSDSDSEDEKQQLSLTENGAIAHSTTESIIFDMFIKLVRGCDAEYIDEHMEKAWIENPVTLMKLVFQTRDIRNGKGERDITYSMLNWIKLNKPLTYYLNVFKLCKEYGRFDDLMRMYFTTYEGNELNMFAKQLEEDTNTDHPTLAGKWAPTEKGQHNSCAYELSKIMFPDDPKHQEKYRKVISGLRKKLDVVERHLCSKEYDKIVYSHVPSKAMLLYGRDSVRKYNSKETDTPELQPGTFIRHDVDRFNEYRKKVSTGEEKINATGIQPHELARTYFSKNDLDETVELQWKAMIDKLRETVNFSSTMAVVDVSGSMSGEPMEVAIALGLIVSELSNEPYKNKVITFESNPQLFNVTGNTLNDRVKCLQRAPWGGSTNFVGTFDLMLNMAKTFEIEQDKMVKTLFVFTDMEFDDASDGDLEEPLFENIKKKYKTAGYEMPKVVFWNLRASQNNAFPVKMSETGTAYVSGFSPVLLNVFMSGCAFDPITILTEMLSRYEVQIHEDEK